MAREFRSYRVEAIVIKHADFGEADRLLTLFTREHGKIRARAKGVRKIRSRRAGHLEPFTRVTLQLAKTKLDPIITQADAIDAYMGLRDNLTLIGYASYVLELLDKFTYEEGENRSLYDLLRDTLARLSNPEVDQLLTLRYYEVRLLDNVGFRPELYICAKCGEEIKPENQFFSPELGGAVCAQDGPHTPGAVPVSVDGLRFLRHFQRSSYRDAAKAAPTPVVHREMEVVMQHYLTYVLERGINSTKFIRRVRREEKG